MHTRVHIIHLCTLLTWGQEGSFSLGSNWWQLLAAACILIVPPLDQTNATHIDWFFMNNLRAILILILQCNSIPCSEFSDSVFLVEKFIYLRLLVQYLWNLVEMCIYESSSCCENFSSIWLHLVSQINFLPKLLESETAVLTLTEFNSKLTFFWANFHANCSATNTRCV